MQKLIKINDNLKIKIECICPSIFRIRANDNDDFPESGLNRYGIIKKNLPEGKTECGEDNDKLILSTTEAILKIDKRTGAATLMDKTEKPLLTGKGTPVSGLNNGFDVSFELAEDERLYGFGDETRDMINKRGHKNRMVVMNVTGYIPIPFVMSDKGWGLFLNTTWYHSFDAGAKEKNTLRFHAGKGLLDYYLISGRSLPDILDKYTDLTGKPYLLPKWGYGLSYVNDEREVRAKDVLNDAYEFRRSDIPCDIMSLAPGWMEKHYDFSVDKKWSEKRFDIPFWLHTKHTDGTFCAALKNMGFRLTLWLCVDYDLSEYEEQLINGPKTENSEDKGNNLEDDIFKDPHFFPQYMDKLTKSGEPWFEHLKQFVDDGAEAFKLDGANQVCFHPDRKWSNGMQDAEMHNLYPVLLSKQMTQGYEKYTGKRASVCTAAGYAGTQQYSSTWSGDTGGREKPLVSLLNHGLSGISNVCTNMGVADAEIHFGFLQALSMAFSWHMYNQPWFLGKKRLAMYRDYAKLRYRIMPYIYSMAHVAAKTAMPIMRAMSLAFTEDKKCDDYIHQYMFGDYFLVSVFADKVYLPKGKWMDYWTGRQIEGPVEIPAEFPENKGGPLFVKAGAIIPSQEDCDCIGIDTPEKIIWELFPCKNSSFTLREDDGESLEYRQGKIAETLLECSEEDKLISITIHPREGSYRGMPKTRRHEIKIHCGNKPDDVNAEWEYDESLKILTVKPIQEKGGKIAIKILL